MMSNTSAKLCFLAAVLTLASACSSFTTQVSPGVNIKDYKTFYVEKLPADERHIDHVIRDEMNKLGLAATAGPGAERPANVAAVVTYEDRWMWDITMYMLSLQINIRNASNDVLLANGSTSYTSLVRKSPEFMAREILTTIFRGERPTSDGATAQSSEQTSQ